jgi:phospholipid/cholesterol/gamma-HCH transport system ATP-binding protein
VFDTVGNLSIASGRRLLRDGGVLVLAVASLWDTLRVVVDRAFPLDHIADAYRLVDSGHKRRNVRARPEPIQTLADQREHAVAAGHVGGHGIAPRRSLEATQARIGPVSGQLQVDNAPPAVEFDQVSLAFDEHVVLSDLSLSIPKGAMRILLGVSGSGKSVILKLVLGLIRPDAGAIRLNGERVDTMTEAELLRVRRDIGMVFQENALFDSLTVAENVGFGLSDRNDGTAEQIRARVDEVLGFVGLGEYAERLPSELSGGQRRRVAIARAMAPRPSLLLFDDPITGLDPLIATTVDGEIIKLRDLEHVTSLVATHQIRDAFYIATHQAERHDGRVRIAAPAPGPPPLAAFMLLRDGRIQFTGTAEELLASEDPYVKEYLVDTLPPW